jgi:hypothetical protein
MLRTSKPVALQVLAATLVAGLCRPPVALAALPVAEALPRVALAAPSPRVGVFVVSLDARAAQQKGLLEGAAEAALERATRFTVVPVQEAFNPAATRGRATRAGDASQKLKAGKQALDDLDNEKATASFTAALEDWKQADLSRDFASLLDAWVMKAAGHATGGENTPARKDIEAVVALAPKTEFSPTFFPPDLIKFAEAQKKLAANAKGELLLRTEPPGARVWVDGVYRGVSPVTVAGLSGGKHFVTATLGGYALGQMEASPGEEVLKLDPAELAPGWKKANTEVSSDPEGKGRDLAAKTLGKAAQLDQVLLVVAKKSLAGEQLDLTALRLETRDGHNAAYRTGTLKTGDPDALTAFFDALVLSDAKRDGKDPVTHFKGGGGGNVKTIAGISLLGLGAAAAIAGGVFGFMASDRANAFRQTPQVQTTVSNNLKSEGQTFAAVADISFLVGIASAATGGVLLLTSSGGGDAAAPERKDLEKEEAARKKREAAERRALEDRRAAEERRKEDERRREEEKKREEERRKEDEKRREEEKAKEEAKAAEPEQSDEEKALSKMSKKERAAYEKKKKAEEAKRAKEEAAAKKAEEAKRAKEEAAAKKSGESEEAAAKRKAEEEAAKKAEEEAAKKRAEEEARKKAEEEAARKKAEEERKREEKRKKEQEEDLRNF